MLATVLINSVVAGGAERVHTNTKATLEKLGKELVLPMACGLVVQIMYNAGAYVVCVMI